MDQLRRLLSMIGVWLGRLTASQKLLIGSVCVILLMTLFVVSQYAGRPERRALMPGQPAEVQRRAATVLAASNITHAVDAQGQVMVGVDDQHRAMAVVMESGQVGVDGRQIFEALVQSQSWMNSKEQNRQLHSALRNQWLAGVIGKFRGVRSAQVLVDAPEQVGFGSPARAPKASVTLFSASGQAVPQETVDAAARFVAGSVAGLELSRVEVIDGTLGRPRTVSDQRELTEGSARETARTIERDWKQKIHNLLPGIEGVAVEVTAVVDGSRSRAQVSSQLPVGQGTVTTPRREQTTSKVQAEQSSAAEPGLRSNVGSDVSQSASGRGQRMTETTEETEFDVAFGMRTEHIETPSGRLKSLAATVGVPRAFIAAMIARERAAAGGAGGAAAGQAAETPPTEEEIQQRFAAERSAIESLLRPHFRVETARGEVVQGEVVVGLISGAAAGAGFGGGTGGGGGGGGGLGGSLGTVWALGGGVIDKVVLGALAVVALGMMLMMARKTGRQVAIPTAEELVGQPPPLETTSDVVGEADESETAMAGIELGEEEIKVGKMREQVSELIQAQPETAAKVLNRWVSPEE